MPYFELRFGSGIGQPLPPLEAVLRPNLEEQFRKELSKLHFNPLHLQLHVGKNRNCSLIFERLSPSAIIASVLVGATLNEGNRISSGQLEAVIFLTTRPADDPMVIHIEQRRDQLGRHLPHCRDVAACIRQTNGPVLVLLCCSKASEDSTFVVQLARSLANAFFPMCAAGCFNSVLPVASATTSTLPGIMRHAGELNVPLPKLELVKVFRDDAREIIAARERAILIHHTKDVNAAGDEVEQAARRVLARKLSGNFHVGHGHIVDASLSVSPQLDLVISDARVFPTLFRGENGTDYVPYESVYAVGEIKSSYQNSKSYVEEFIRKLAMLRMRLKRRPVASALPFALTDGGIGPVVPPQPPDIFSFMLFVDDGDFSVDDIREQFIHTPPSSFPHMLCFLNTGVVRRVAFENPEFDPGVLKPGLQWVLMRSEKSDDPEAQNFATLYAAICDHLHCSGQTAPDLSRYFANVFSEEVQVEVFDLGVKHPS